MHHYYHEINIFSLSISLFYFIVIWRKPAHCQIETRKDVMETIIGAKYCMLFFWNIQPPLNPSVLYLSILPCSLRTRWVGWPRRETEKSVRKQWSFSQSRRKLSMHQEGLTQYHVCCTLFNTHMHSQRKWSNLTRDPCRAMGQWKTQRKNLNIEVC